MDAIVAPYAERLTALAGENVTGDNFIRGAVVSRGPDWKWGDQDESGSGRLLRLAADKIRCWVRWADETEHDYRIGSADAFDLVYGPKGVNAEDTDSDEEEMKCPVCIDSIPRGRYNRITCAAGHVACKNCLDACIIQTFANARRSNAEEPVLHCFADDACECELELIDIARVADKDATQTYLNICQQYRDAQALAEVHAALQVELRRLRSALKSGTGVSALRDQCHDDSATATLTTAVTSAAWHGGCPVERLHPHGLQRLGRGAGNRRGGWHHHSSAPRHRPRRRP
jgi:hypothetical protein